MGTAPLSVRCICYKDVLDEILALLAPLAGAVRDRDGAQPPRHACANMAEHIRAWLHRQKLRTTSKASVARAEELGGARGRYAHWAL